MAYSPAQHSLTGKPMGFSQANPTDARSFFYDGTNFVYRPYVSTSEVLSYLNLSKYRFGDFPIYINSTGSLQGDGTITGGTIDTYHFKDGTADANLVRSFPILSHVVATFGGGGTTTINVDTTGFAVLTLTGNTILAFSGTPVEGQNMVVAATASGADRTVTLGSSFVIPTSSTVTSPITVLSGTETLFAFRWKSSNSKWRLVSLVDGY